SPSATKRPGTAVNAVRLPWEGENHMPAAAKTTLKPPLPPMEAKLVAALPEGEGWQFEPKWDGFRCLIFRDGGAVALQSKAGRPLERYFPEVAAMVAGLAADRFALD